MKTIPTVAGEVRVSRAYYHCRHCGGGQAPRDARSGPGTGDLSRGAARAVALAGTPGSFAEAATKVLPKPTGLRVGESTVERATERAGRQVGGRLAAGATFGPPTAWAWTPDAEGKTCAYVAADLTGVGMQGPGAKASEGRMAAVGMSWNAGEGGRVRYACGLAGGLAALGDPLRRQGEQAGMGAAARWLAVTDGGAGIEDGVRVNFPRVEAVILDFYHAAEHLCAWAKAWYGPGAEAEREGAGWCHRLKHEGGAAGLAALRAADVQEPHRQVLVYVENQVHRMDYPTYRAKGWLIGSGPVEAACKQLVNQRLKGSGMRWSESGADAVCHLRALFRSEKGQWGACWATPAA